MNVDDVESSCEKRERRSLGSVGTSREQFSRRIHLGALIDCEPFDWLYVDTRAHLARARTHKPSTATTPTTTPTSVSVAEGVCSVAAASNRCRRRPRRTGGQVHVSCVRVCVCVSARGRVLLARVECCSFLLTLQLVRLRALNRMWEKPMDRMRG